MSLSYHPSFSKGNSMNKTRAFEASYNSVNENLHFGLDQLEDGLSQRAAHYSIHHLSISQAHESSQSLQQSTQKNSTLTQASKDYFQQIERSLLLQNQNLKNHNRYLLDQVKRLFMREKVMKRTLLEHQNTIKTLQTIILDSQINLRSFFEDMVLLIEELQIVNRLKKECIVWDQQVERQNENSFYVQEEAKTNSQDIFNSLEKIKNIFGQSQIMDEIRLKLCTKSTLEHENPEYGQQVFQHGVENQSEQGFHFNENEWQAPQSSVDLPILCSFKNKILDLCMKISSQTNNTKGVYFNKQ